MANEILPSPEESRSESAGLLARFFGIIFSPTETFQKLVERPLWLGMLILICTIAALTIGGFLMTEAGQAAWLDAAMEASSGLNTIDLLIIWWVIVVSIGLGVLYKRKTKSIALFFLAIYGLIALIVALVRGS